MFIYRWERSNSESKGDHTVERRTARIRIFKRREEMGLCAQG